MQASDVKGMGASSGATAEDMAEYLQRMHKQLEEMTAQHQQTTPPKRESLARATALYYERKATSEAGTPFANSEASTPNAAAGKIPSRSPYRSSSMGGAQAAVGIRSLPIQQMKGAAVANLGTAAEHVPAAGSLSARRLIKASSEGGVRSTGAAAADAAPANVTSACTADGEAERPTAHTAAVSTAEATNTDPVAAISNNDAADMCTPVKPSAGEHTLEQEQLQIRQPQTEPKSRRPSLTKADGEQQQQQQETTPMRNRLALFHSPQASKAPSFRRGSDSGCRKAPVKALAAGFDAAAAGGGGGGMRSYRARSEAGAAAGKGATAAAVSRSGSSKWQRLGGASKPDRTTPVSKSTSKPPRAHTASVQPMRSFPGNAGASQSFNSSSSSRTPGRTRSGTAAGEGEVSFDQRRRRGSSSSGIGSLGSQDSSSSRVGLGVESAAGSSMFAEGGPVEVTDSMFASAGALLQPLGSEEGPVEVTDLHEEDEEDVLAAVEDAIDAAAAAVNNPVVDIITARRLSADSRNGSRQLLGELEGSFRGSSFSQRGSSSSSFPGVVGGPATEAAVGRSAGVGQQQQQLFEVVPPLEALALEVMQQEGEQEGPLLQEMSLSQQQLQQQHELSSSGVDLLGQCPDAAVAAVYSIVDACQSEVVNQGSVAADCSAWLADTAASDSCADVAADAAAAAAAPDDADSPCHGDAEAAAARAIQSGSAAGFYCSSPDATQDAAGTSQQDIPVQSPRDSFEASAAVPSDTAAPDAVLEACPATVEYVAQLQQQQQVDVAKQEQQQQEGCGRVDEPEQVAAGVLVSAEITASHDSNTMPEDHLAPTPSAPPACHQPLLDQQQQQHDQHAVQAKDSRCSRDSHRSSSASGSAYTLPSPRSLLVSASPHRQLEDLPLHQMSQVLSARGSSGSTLSSRSRSRSSTGSGSGRDSAHDGLAIAAFPGMEGSLQVLLPLPPPVPQHAATAGQGLGAGCAQQQARSMQDMPCAEAAREYVEAGGTVSGAAALEPLTAAAECSGAVAAATSRLTGAGAAVSETTGAADASESAAAGDCDSWDTAGRHQRQEGSIAAAADDDDDDADGYASNTVAGTAAAASPAGFEASKADISPAPSAGDVYAVPSVVVGAAAGDDMVLMGSPASSPAASLANVPLLRIKQQASSTRFSRDSSTWGPADSPTAAAAADGVVGGEDSSAWVPPDSPAAVISAAAGAVADSSTLLAGAAAASKLGVVLPAVSSATMSKGEVVGPLLSPSATVPPAAGAITASPKQHWRHRDGDEQHQQDLEVSYDGVPLSGSLPSPAVVESPAGPNSAAAAAGQAAPGASGGSCAWPRLEPSSWDMAPKAGACAAAAAAGGGGGEDVADPDGAYDLAGSLVLQPAASDAEAVDAHDSTQAVCAGLRASSSSSCLQGSLQLDSMDDTEVQPVGVHPLPHSPQGLGVGVGGAVLEECAAGVADEAAGSPRGSSNSRSCSPVNLAGGPEEQQQQQQQPGMQQGEQVEVSQQLLQEHERLQQQQLQQGLPAVGVVEPAATAACSVVSGSAHGLEAVGGDSSCAVEPCADSMPPAEAPADAAAAALLAASDAGPASISTGNGAAAASAAAMFDNAADCVGVSMELVNPLRSLQVSPEPSLDVLAAEGSTEIVVVAQSLHLSHTLQQMLEPEQQQEHVVEEKAGAPVHDRWQQEPGASGVTLSEQQEYDACPLQEAQSGSHIQQEQQQQEQRGVPHSSSTGCSPAPSSSTGFSPSKSPGKSPSKLSWGARVLGKISSALCRQNSGGTRSPHTQLEHEEQQWQQEGLTTATAVQGSAQASGQMPYVAAAPGLQQQQQATVGPDALRHNSSGSGGRLVSCNSELDRVEAAGQLLLGHQAEAQVPSGQHNQAASSTKGGTSSRGETFLTQHQEASAVQQQQQAGEVPCDLEQPTAVQQQQQQQSQQQVLVAIAASGNAPQRQRVSTAGSRQAAQPRTVDLAVAAVVGVAGVGLAASLGTPAPHLVSCGSILHAPTLAAVALRLAASAGRHCSDSPSSGHALGSSRGSEDAVGAAVAATSVAVWAAALVAAWELDDVGDDYSQTFEESAAAEAAGDADSNADIDADSDSEGSEPEGQCSEEFDEAVGIRGASPSGFVMSAGPSAADVEHSCSSRVHISTDDTLVTPGDISVGDLGQEESLQQQQQALQQQQQERYMAASFQQQAGLQWPQQQQGDGGFADRAWASPIPECLTDEEADEDGDAFEDSQHAQWQQQQQLLHQQLLGAQEVAEEHLLSTHSSSSSPGSHSPSSRQAQVAETAGGLPQGASSSILAGLPELVQDVSCVAPARPAVYDAGRYKEPTSPQAFGVDAENSQGTQADSRSSSRAGYTAAAAAAPEALPTGQMQQQAQPQQQQQQRVIEADIRPADNAHAAEGTKGIMSKACHAVRQLKLLRLHSRPSSSTSPNSNQPAPSSTSTTINAPAAAAAVAAGAAALRQNSQRLQLQQGMLPSDISLGHGVLADTMPTVEQQQEQQEMQAPPQQQQQQQGEVVGQSSSTTMSVNEYYKMLLQQQQQLQAEQQSVLAQAASTDSTSSNDTISRAEQDPAALNNTAQAVDSTTGPVPAKVPSPERQKAALAKLKQGMLLRSQRLQSLSATAGSAPVGAGGQGGWQQQEGGEGPTNQGYGSNSSSPSPRRSTGPRHQHSGGSRGVWAAELSSGDEGGQGGGSSSEKAAAPKPFLKRRSQQIQGRKLDWSNVQSKTQTRLDSRYVPLSKGRRQLPSSAHPQGFSSSVTSTSSIPRQQQQQHIRQPSQQSSTYDPALAAARARAGLMDPGAGPKSNRGRVRSSNVYSGYEPGYELEVHSSTYYRSRPHTVGSSTNSIPQSLRTSAGEAGGYAATAGGYSSSRSPWLSSSREGVPAGLSRSSSLGRAGAGASSHAAVHSQFDLGSIAGAYGGASGSSRKPAGGVPAEAPLDDLLQHVNHLISEFDRMYAD